jgi:hypothetical protein
MTNLGQNSDTVRIEDEGWFIRSAYLINNHFAWLATLMTVKYGHILVLLCAAAFLYLGQLYLLSGWRRYTVMHRNYYIIERYLQDLKKVKRSARAD